MCLGALGINSSWLFVREVFGWRKIQNRRQIGAIVGLTPTPYASGTSSREQGISRAGNRRMRAMAIEIAWLWLRYQAESELSRWQQASAADRHCGVGEKVVGCVTEIPGDGRDAARRPIDGLEAKEPLHGESSVIASTRRRIQRQVSERRITRISKNTTAGLGKRSYPGLVWRSQPTIRWIRFLVRLPRERHRRIRIGCPAR